MCNFGAGSLKNFGKKYFLGFLFLAETLAELDVFLLSLEKTVPLLFLANVEFSLWRAV